MGIMPLDAYAAVVAGVCCASYLYFGFYLSSVVALDVRFRPLLFTCFFSSAWSLCYLLYFLSRSAAGRELFHRLAYAGMIVFVQFLWFILRYTRLIKNRRMARFVSAALWLPPLLGACAGIAGNAVVRDFPEGFWFVYAEAQTFAYNSASVLFMLLYYVRHKTRRSIGQAYLLCGSGLALMVLSLAADYYLGFRNLLNIIPVWFLVWLGVLLHAIRKHGFLPVTPGIINRDITENIEEGIILLDPDLRTVFMNGPAARFLDARDGTPACFPDIAPQNRGLREQLLALPRTGATSLNARVDLTRRGGAAPLAVDLHVRRIFDSYGNPTAYLAVLSRVKNLQHLKSAYGITRREMEVLLQLASGKTNKEISVMLDISEKTVETHIASIYGRLLVRNRVELLKLLSGYDS